VVVGRKKLLDRSSDLAIIKELLRVHVNVADPLFGKQEQGFLCW
jgi:hypothetical protein